MTSPLEPAFVAADLDALATAEGRVAVLVDPSGKLDRFGRRINRLTRGALARLVESRRFSKLGEGDAVELAFPAGMAAEAVKVVKLGRRADAATARKAGGRIGNAVGKAGVLVAAGSFPRTEELVLGAMLRAYAFDAHKSRNGEPRGPLTAMVSRPEDLAAAAGRLKARAGGVLLTRDLVNEPANVLTTTEFARRLEALSELGVKVEVLEEDRLAELGMGALLGVGQGSESPTKVVVMEWRGGAQDAAPLALVGKGVVFDTGGISIKPAAGMEDMTMDMGGAAVVAGTMHALAARKAAANVVGLVGLVENMPDGRAQRPGDVVRSMKGDTIEVINTDAEGRLVLADVLWYAQERFSPSGIVDLATLTGAIIIALGHVNAGVFSNDDRFCDAFLKAAAAEGEGAWRMPLGKQYDEQLKSRIADVKNVGGRPAGAVTAAQFLQRFVKDGVPWIHLDIAGVASVKTASPLAPKGATGWGVLALDRLVADTAEG